MKIHELLSDMDSWCRKALALDEMGSPCSPRSRRAVQWSLIGATRRCYTFRYEKVLARLRSTLKCGVADFNDNPHTSFVMVRTLAQRLDV